MRMHIWNIWSIMYSLKRVLVNTTSGFEYQILVIQFDTYHAPQESDWYGCSTHEVPLNVVSNHIQVNHPNSYSHFHQFLLHLSVNLKSCVFFFIFVCVECQSFGKKRSPVGTHSSLAGESSVILWWCLALAQRRWWWRGAEHWLG